MKKLLASLVAVFALLPAQAASADILNLSAGVFPQDQFSALSSTGDAFAVGGGTNTSGTHFAFSAHCKDANGDCFSGTAPSGYAVVSDPTFGDAQGHVCAEEVLSNIALFVIVVEKGTGILGSHPNVAFEVSDGGPVGVPDRFGEDPSVGCLGGVEGVFPLVQGNIVVKNR
jgi:hypothetical protein